MKRSDIITLYYDAKNKMYYTKNNVRNSNDEDVLNASKVSMSLDTWLANMMSEILKMKSVQDKEQNDGSEEVRKG